MSETKIDASELKDEGGEAINELAALLKDKTNVEVKTDGFKLTVKGEGAAASKKYVKVLLKKFLHKRELKESYRVIIDKDGGLKIKERRTYEEE